MLIDVIGKETDWLVATNLTVCVPHVPDMVVLLMVLCSRHSPGHVPDRPGGHPDCGGGGHVLHHLLWLHRGPERKHPSPQDSKTCFFITVKQSHARLFLQSIDTMKQSTTVSSAISFSSSPSA